MFTCVFKRYAQDASPTRLYYSVQTFKPDFVLLPALSLDNAEGNKSSGFLNLPCPLSLALLLYSVTRGSGMLHNTQ